MRAAKEVKLKLQRSNKDDQESRRAGKAVLDRDLTLGTNRLAFIIQATWICPHQH